MCAVSSVSGVWDMFEGVGYITSTATGTEAKRFVPRGLNFVNPDVNILCSACCDYVRGSLMSWYGVGHVYVPWGIVGDSVC